MTAAANLTPIERAGRPSLLVGCCAYSYRDYLQGRKTPAMTLERFLDLAADIGIAGVELTSYYFPDDVTPGFVHRLARRAWQLGLDVPGGAVGNTFTLPPGPDRDKNIALAKRWIDFTPDMGGRYIRIFAGSAPQGVDDDTARGWVADCVRECCDYAGEKGIMLALENHGGVVATPEGMFDVMRRVNSEWFTVNLDTGNFHSADPYADVARLAPYAATTHIKTEMSVDGALRPADLGRIVDVLKGVGYRGYLHLEYEAAEDPSSAVPRVLRELLTLTR